MKRLLLVLLVQVAWMCHSQAISAQQGAFLTTVIKPGTLGASIRNDSGNRINSFSFDLGNESQSDKCRGNKSPIQGIIGEESRFYIENPQAADSGWALSLAPADGKHGSWSNKAGSKFDYNDPGTNKLGCDDSDNDGLAGNLSVMLDKAVIEADCKECSLNNIAGGSVRSESFSEHDSVTLLKANSQSDDIGRWYIRGVDLIQTVPAGQQGDDYSLELVLTAAAS